MSKYIIEIDETAKNTIKLFIKGDIRLNIEDEFYSEFDLISEISKLSFIYNILCDLQQFDIDASINIFFLGLHDELCYMTRNDEFIGNVERFANYV